MNRIINDSKFAQIFSCILDMSKVEMHVFKFSVTENRNETSEFVYSYASLIYVKFIVVDLHLINSYTFFHLHTFLPST